MDNAKSSSDIDFNHVVFESVTVSGDNVDHREQILKICISDWNLTEHIGLSRTRQQLISVRDILFA